MAITGLHAIVYSRQDQKTREFFRDVLGFPSVDAGRGWLIFAAPPAELAVHPAEGTEHHELYLMCDDIDKTVADLAKKGVKSSAVQDQPWGRLVNITLPSGQQLGIYQPRHPVALGLKT
ncbi:MAG TPA: VOC family protein [Gemmatimonadaceae bacterium]|nr:VOC family protein [Gemmatimonadaceae bacterium]